MTTDARTAARERARIMWDAGDFGSIARRTTAVGEDIVARTGVRAGDRVLDLACGTGNATLPAARAGAETVGLDIAPGLLAQARRLAAREGLDVEFVLGDCEELPWPDGSFDVVLSTFGCMFAPRHEAVAAQIARVLRPGGRMGVCAWTPEGRIGRFFMTVMQHAPAPPPGFRPPGLWGVEDHVRGLFADLPVEPAFDRATIRMVFDSPQAAAAEFETKFGPVIMAMAGQADEAGRRALHEDLLRMYEELGESGPDGRMVFDAEYLVTQGRRLEA